EIFHRYEFEKTASMIEKKVVGCPAKNFNKASFFINRQQIQKCLFIALEVLMRLLNGVEDESLFDLQCKRGEICSVLRQLVGVSRVPRVSKPQQCNTAGK